MLRDCAGTSAGPSTYKLKTSLLMAHQTHRLEVINHRD